MKAIERKVVDANPDGSYTVEAFIIANTAPSPLPTNGRNIVGLAPTDRFAPFSIIFCTDASDPKIYIANEQGEFIGQ